MFRVWHAVGLQTESKDRYKEKFVDWTMAILQLLNLTIIDSLHTHSCLYDCLYDFDK